MKSTYLNANPSVSKETAEQKPLKKNAQRERVQSDSWQFSGISSCSVDPDFDGDTREYTTDLVERIKMRGSI